MKGRVEHAAATAHEHLTAVSREHRDRRAVWRKLNTMTENLVFHAVSAGGTGYQDPADSLMDLLAGIPAHAEEYGKFQVV